MLLNCTYVGKSQYKHVYIYKQGSKVAYVVKVQKYGLHRTYDDEITAAKQVDLFLISIGKRPVNILKPVKK